MHPNTSLKQAVPHSINNSQIEQLLAMRETQKGLKERLNLMAEAVEKAENVLIDQVIAGADLSACGFEVCVQEIVRRYPAWKEHFIGKLGKSEADVVMENTTPVIHRKLVVK